MFFRKKKDEDLLLTLAENVKLNPNEAIVTRKFVAFHSPTHKKTLFILGDYRGISEEKFLHLISEKNKSVLN